MKKDHNKIFKSLAMITSSVSCALISGYLAFAGAKDEISNGYKQAGADTSGLDTDLKGSVIGKVINTMMFFVGLLSVVMLIYSGLRYITAHGDKTQIESAKNTMIYAIVGLIIAIISYAVVNWTIGLF